MFKSQNSQSISVPMFIRGMAMDNKLRVVFGGDTPGYSADQHCVYMPAYQTFDASQLHCDATKMAVASAIDDIFCATGLHEIGHPLETHADPSYRNSSELGGFLWNAIEDIRVDSNRQRVLRGANRMFQAGYSRLIKMGYWTKPDPFDPRRAFTTWVLAQGRAKLADQTCFSDLGEHSEAAVLQLFGASFRDDAWSILSRVSACRPGKDGTKDVFRIVEDLLALLQTASQPSPQQQPSTQDAHAGDEDESEDGGQPSSGQAGDEDESEDGGQPSSQSASRSQEDSSSSDSDGNGDGGSSCAEKSTQGAASSTADPAGSARSVLDSGELPLDVGSALSDALNDATKEATAMGATTVPIPESEAAKPDMSMYTGDRDTVPMGRRIRGLMMSRGSSPVSYDRVGCRIDPQMMMRIPFGEVDVFAEEREVRMVNLAVRLVVDCSQSMTGSRIVIARQAALRIALALTSIENTSVSVSAFPHHVGTNTDVRELLPFGGDPRRYASNFLDLYAPLWASTPMAQALVDADFALSRRRETRKICVVLTDGQPNFGTAQSCKSAIHSMTRKGVEVVGIGIETMYCNDLFPRFEVVHQVKDLEKALFALFKPSLRKAA